MDTCVCKGENGKPQWSWFGKCRAHRYRYYHIKPLIKLWLRRKGIIQ